MLNIREVVKSIDIDTSDLDLITWSGCVNHVVEDKNLLLSGDSARRDCTRGLLYGHLLIVSIDSVHFIDNKGTIALTHHALTEEGFAFLGI